MAALVRRGLCGQQIAAQLADVLEHRAALLGHVAPEPAGGEAAADHHRATRRQHGPGRHHPADAVIQRQAVVEPVVGRGVHHAGEPAAPHHHPLVADMGGLGQASGARGVDQQRRLAERRGRILVRRQRRGRSAIGRPVRTQRPYLQPQLGGHEVGQLGIDDHVARARHLQAMRQGVAAQIGVDQRHHAAHPRHAQPTGQILRPVRRQQRHRLAADQPPLQRPARIGAQPSGQFGVAKALVLADQGGCVALPFGHGLDHHRQGLGGGAAHLARPLQRPQPGLVGAGGLGLAHACTLAHA